MRLYDPSVLPPVTPQLLANTGLRALRLAIADPERCAVEGKVDGVRGLVTFDEDRRLGTRNRRGEPRQWLRGQPLEDSLRRLGNRLRILWHGTVLDGELVALDDERPSFPRLSNRILHGHDGIAVTYVIFDVLVSDGVSTMAQPYEERRAILSHLELNGTAWCTPDVFDDGERLFAAVVRQRLEGIVAKPLLSAYRPGERDWLKVKNRTYWRFGQELELTRSRRRAFV